MTTKINLGDKAYLLQDEHSYAPYYLKKGGDMVRNPATGELIESKDKFIHTGTWHVELRTAIRELAKYEVLSVAEFKNLEDYVRAYNNAYNFLENQLK